MKIAIAGAGAGGLAAGIRLAAAGHDVTVLEQAPAPGGKCGRLELDGGFRFDTGPSLLTMPWVFSELFADTGAPLHDEVELVRVEPVTRYRFADGTGFDMSADLPRAMDELEAWSPGSGTDWARFLGTCAGMWRASVPFLTGPPPWPPRRPRRGDPRPDPRDFLRVRPWQTLRGVARAHARDPRLQMVIERFGTYAGADPRRAPAALAVAGYVEHAWGAWHVRGGMYSLVEAMARRLEEVGGELRCGEPVRALVRQPDGRVTGVETDTGAVPADAVVWNGDALALARDRLLPTAKAPETDAMDDRSLSGFALMLAVRGRDPGTAHHTIAFPADYDAEFDDVFYGRRAVREPTLYASVSSASDPGEAPDDGENWFVLVNAPLHGSGFDWNAAAGAYEEHLLDRLEIAGLGVRERLVESRRRTPADLERETGAIGGAIYGRAPHGRLGTMKRPANVVRGAPGLYLVGGTTHPGGGLPLAVLSGRIVAEEIGRAG